MSKKTIDFSQFCEIMQDRCIRHWLCIDKKVRGAEKQYHLTFIYCVSRESF